MPCCCAYGCHNRSEQGFKFYRFPTNHIRKAVWLNNIKRSGWTPSRFAVVCQEHFTDDQFENKRADGRRMLKWTGVPTLFFHRNEPKIQRSKPRESKKNPRSSIVLNSSGSSTAEHGNVQSDHTYSDMQPKGTMGTEKDQLLAKTVGKYKWLYHALNPSYKDTTMKRNSWNEVAQLVGVNVEECKARWTILRDRYVRFRKTSNMPPPSRVGIGVAPTPKWYLYPLMHSMLHNTIQHRSGDSLASTSAGSTTLESCVEDTSAPLVEIIVTDVDTHQPSVSVEAEATEGGGASSRPILTKKRQTDRDTLQNLHHLREKRPVMLEGLCQTSSDSDDDSEGGGPEGDDCIIKEEEEIDDSVHDAGSPAGAKPSKKITEPKTKLQNTRRKGRGIQKAKVKQRTGISRIFQPDQLRALKRVNMSEDHEDLWLPPTVKKALQLRFACRPTGYKQLLDHQFPLPSERTLQRKMQKVPFQPGVLGDIFDKLEIKVKEMNDTDRLCSLTLDELSLTPCVEYDADNGNLLGNVTLPQHTGMADHALVITLGGIITRWKQTVAYHYTNNMTDGTVLKEIILDIIEHANDIGLHVEAVTSDMGSASLAMWRSFGISCSRHCPTVHKIPQPQVPGKWLYFLAYVPHVLNNIKAAIVNENMLKLSDSTVEQHMLKSNVVSVEPLKDLAKFQEDLQSKLAPKLTMATLMPGHFDEKKASNATQVFSRDVSSGLKHLVNKEGRKEEYLTTAWLIQILSHWCKLMTNWHPVLALCRYDPEKYEETVYFLQKVIRIFESLKIGIGGDWEPIQTAVIISTYSVLDIAEALLDDDYKFLLTSTLTQDCLENLFSFVCLREPAPSPLEFKYALNMICVAQFLTLPSSDSYEKDEREFLADFLDQENIFLREPEVCKLNFSGDEHVESMAEHDSLHDLIGYCIHSIKNTEKTCDQCLKEVIAAPSRSAHHIAEEYRKGLVAVSEKAYVMFLRVEHMFRKAQNYLMEKTNVKRVLMDEAEIYAKDFELPTCHNIKNKLITKFIESRLHLYCRKKSDEYEKETGKEEES